jgi:DNA-binding NtrC family response regulator
MLLAHSEARLLESVDRFSPECTVVLSSTAMDPDALRVAERVRSIDHNCPLLMMTSGISADTAICAMRAGVSDMLERDAPREKIVATLRSLTGKHPVRAHANDGRDLIDGQRLAGTGGTSISPKCTTTT